MLSLLSICWVKQLAQRKVNVKELPNSIITLCALNYMHESSLHGLMGPSLVARRS